MNIDAHASSSRAYPDSLPPIQQNTARAEWSVWEKTKACFPLHHQDDALHCLQELCHPPKGTTPEAVKGSVERLRTFAYPGRQDNIQCNTAGSHRFSLLDEDSHEILSVTIDAEAHTVAYAGEQKSYQYEKNTANGDHWLPDPIESMPMDEARHVCDRVNFQQLIEQRNDIFNQTQKIRDALLAKRTQKGVLELNNVKEKFSRCHSTINEYELQRDISHGIGIQLKKEFHPPHRGEHCKLSALALLDAYFSDLLGKNSIPLLAEKNAPTSLRKIAKTFGSRQGEILQVDILKNIAEHLGYHVELVRAACLSDFRRCIEENVSHKGIITFYSIMNENPYNIKQSANAFYEERLEHAAVISKYDKERDVCTLNYWGEKFPGSPVALLFNSNQKLKKTRNMEFYNVSMKQHRHLHTEPEIGVLGKKEYKYTLIPQLYSLGRRLYEFTDYMETLTPVPDSGFHGVTMIIEPNTAHARWRD